MAPGAFKSAELVEDSDSESETSSSSSDEPAPKKQTSAPKKKIPSPKSSSSEESTSEESSADESDSGDERPPAAEADSDDSDTESSSSSGSSSDSDDSDKPAPAQSKKRKATTEFSDQASKRSKSVTIDDTPARSDGVSQDATPAKSSFAPPEGFALLQLSDDSHAILSKSNLEGKELWHITAPSSVSIRDLQEIDMSAVRKGKRVMTSNGNDYGLFTVPGDLPSDVRLLVPQKGANYVAAPTSFKKVLNLQQFMPDIASFPTPGSVAPLVKEKPVVQQPVGLKTQHFPAGFEPTPSKPPKAKATKTSADAGSAPPTSEKKKKKREKTEDASTSTPSQSEKHKEKKKKAKKEQKRMCMDP